MNKIFPCLWFDSEAEEAVEFYKTVFSDVKVLNVSKYVSETPSNKPIGSVMTIEFEINGNKFMALNAGSYFKMNEAVSFVITCKDQEEMNHYYDKLSAVPEAEVCGWLKDKFGVSWQLVTEGFDELMTGPNAKEVMSELLKMKRLDINKLREIHEGK